MSFKKKLFAIIMTLSISLGLCSQVLAADHLSADPRGTVETSKVTYADGTSSSIASNSLLLMVNGSMMQNSEVRLINGIPYVPVKDVIEALGGTFTSSRNTAVVTYNGMTFNLETLSPVVGLGNKFYNIGAPVRFDAGKMYAPLLYTVNTSFVNVELVYNTPYGRPLIAIDQPVKYNISSTSVAQELVSEIVNIPVTHQIGRFTYQDWFREVGVQGLATAIELFREDVMSATLDSKFSIYLHYKGENIGYLVNRLNGDIFFTRDGAVLCIDDVDFSALLEQE